MIRDLAAGANHLCITGQSARRVWTVHDDAWWRRIINLTSREGFRQGGEFQRVVRASRPPGASPDDLESPRDEEMVEKG
jgi:hypothetical protein